MLLQSQIVYKVSTMEEQIYREKVLVFYLHICFFYYFGQIGNIYKVEQDSLYFFLEGAFKGIYLRERNFTLSYVVSEI